MLPVHPYNGEFVYIEKQPMPVIGWEQKLARRTRENGLDGGKKAWRNDKIYPRENLKLDVILENIAEANIERYVEKFSCIIAIAQRCIA